MVRRYGFSPRDRMSQRIVNAPAVLFAPVYAPPTGFSRPAHRCYTFSFPIWLYMYILYTLRSNARVLHFRTTRMTKLRRRVRFTIIKRGRATIYRRNKTVYDGLVRFRAVFPEFRSKFERAVVRHFRKPSVVRPQTLRQ